MILLPLCFETCGSMMAHRLDIIYKATPISQQMQYHDFNYESLGIQCPKIPYKNNLQPLELIIIGEKQDSLDLYALGPCKSTETVAMIAGDFGSPPSHFCALLLPS